MNAWDIFDFYISYYIIKNNCFIYVFDMINGAWQNHMPPSNYMYRCHAERIDSRYTLGGKTAYAWVYQGDYLLADMWQHWRH